MTTIACDSTSMVGDGYITSGDTILQTNCVKVRKVKDGRIVGVAGNTYSWDSIFAYFNGEISNWPSLSSSTAVIVLDTDGKVFIYDETGRPWQRPSPTAIGSGRNFAIGALDAGIDIISAVKIACGRDTHSGGDLTIVSL